MESLPNTHIQLETERLLLRPFNFGDTLLLAEAVNNNIEHLRWIPWGKDLPATPEYQMSKIRQWLGNFMHNIDYVYGIFDKQTLEILGSTGLHTRQGKGILEIGYWIRKDKEGMGYVSEAVKEMERIATDVLKAEKIEIRCEPENHRSAKVAERLGYMHDCTMTTLEKKENGERRKLMVWVKFNET